MVVQTRRPSKASQREELFPVSEGMLCSSTELWDSGESCCLPVLKVLRTENQIHRLGDILFRV